MAAAPAAGAAVTESVFVRIPALAARHGAVNLAQGVFDHGPEPVLLDALAAVGGGVEHQYAPSPGHPRLRAALARHVERHDGAAVRPDEEITVTVGATEALHCAITALVRPGSEVLLVEPAYEQYAPVVRSAGGVPRALRLRSARERVTAEELEALVTPATRAIVVNTPWNPLGRALDEQEWRAVAGLAERHGIVVVSDEPYEHLSLDGSPHRGVLAAVPDPELRIKISSVSKTFAATGWRIGWAVAGPELTRRIRAVHQFLTFCPPTPLQLATAAVLDDPGTGGVLERRARELGEKVRGFAADLRGLGLPAETPDCGFFVLADVGEDAEDWCHRMITDAGVAGLPMSVFYSEPVAGTGSIVRFAACKRQETLTEAVRRLGSVLR
ncbi:MULTISPECIES: pyridoxal phosphate-dependent aminotransferase [Streptomyces]|uniref:Aminotransferase n=1 Tax=Streptomyces lycii TaxID=2654337 RepID=A0ABQ7FNG7_9ACTN|nr:MULTISPECIES: aminotransferase class I/II-fold pyridoxal phosphate-dependent enzyme [Streptomyces]KAF4409543.1 aminotransferase class I/II-fold pyridoxal phosphate-dependent enzyme [Streptomyces lycii]PGH48097.1 aminotransferase [Streptomyces sp. Ru87]